VLLISQYRLFNHAPFGAVSHIQAAVHYKFYTVHVLMRQWKFLHFEGVAEITELCQIMEEKSEYKFSPGIDPEWYNREYFEVI